MTIEEWLKYGEAQGFCTERFCMTHDGYPMTQKEAIADEQGDDLCCWVMRLGSPADWDNNI